MTTSTAKVGSYLRPLLLGVIGLVGFVAAAIVPILSYLGIRPPDPDMVLTPYHHIVHVEEASQRTAISFDPLVRQLLIESGTSTEYLARQADTAPSEIRWLWGRNSVDSPILAAELFDPVSDLSLILSIQTVEAKLEFTAQVYRGPIIKQVLHEQVRNFAYVWLYYDGPSGRGLFELTGAGRHPSLGTVQFNAKDTPSGVVEYFSSLKYLMLHILFASTGVMPMLQVRDDTDRRIIADAFNAMASRRSQGE